MRIYRTVRVVELTAAPRNSFEWTGVYRAETCFTCIFGFRLVLEGQLVLLKLLYGSIDLSIILFR